MTTATRQDDIVTDTVAKSFMNAVAHWGDAIALREKDMGIWKAKTWREWAEISINIAHALHAEGFKPGDIVSILSNTNPEWIYADMGVLIAGGVCSGIYPTDSMKQCDYLINDSGTSIIFVEDDEQLDKVLQIRPQCPNLKRIVIFDMEGLVDFHDPMCISLDEFIAIGKAYRHGRGEGLLKDMLDSRTRDDLAVLVYTSGTTGPPKGAMHANRSICSQMKHAKNLYNAEPGDDRLLFLPLCHVAERLGGYYTSIALGPIMNFAESPETVPDNIREVQPRSFLAVPRVWEKFYSGIQIAMQDATSVEKWAYKTAIGIGFKMADTKLAGETPSLGLRMANQIGYWMALRNIRKMMGIDNARMLFTGAAPISPDLIRWYLALGVDMYEVYGQTENCGVATAMPVGQMKLGTIGKAVPWCEVKLSPDNEILIKGDILMTGYLNKPDQTAATIKDGWLHTGDVGSIDNQGYVKITDRMKDIIITAGGKNITPSEIENGLKFSPYISDAVVIGDKRAFLTCLVMIDLDNVEKFAQDRNIPFTNYASLCRAKEVQDLIWGEIEKVNANFARVETIKKFFLIDTQLTAEDEELTPTLKLKRTFVNKKYAKQIDAMYGKAEKVAA